MDPNPSIDYRPSALWIADVLLKGNRLLSVLPGLGETEEDRERLDSYNLHLVTMAAGNCRLGDGTLENSQAEEHYTREIVTVLSQLRRAVNAQLRAAGTRETSAHNKHFSYSALDWLRAAANDNLGASKPPPTPIYENAPPCFEPYGDMLVQGEDIIATAECGLKKLRAFLEDLTAHYMEVTVTERAQHAMEVLKSPSVDRLVRGALNMQLLVCFFDNARLAAGARAAHAAWPRLQGLSPDVVRAEEGRASAYMGMRLYAALEIVIGMMMMGCARKAQDDGNREAWPETPAGKAVLAYRQQVGAVLTAYDSHKRNAAIVAAKTYTAQTAGYVAALQEQAASLSMHAIEGDGALFEGLALGFGSASVILMPSNHNDQRHTLWSAISHIGHERSRSEHEIGWSVQTAMTAAVSTLVFHAVDSKTKSTTQFTDAMRKAMAEASRYWPPVHSFYGRDFQDTDRKVTSKAAREGRDPHGRETGEAFGYRADWMGYLSGNPTRPKSLPNIESEARIAAAISSAAVVEGLCVHGANRMPIAATGNAVHVIHGASLTMEPQQLARAHHAGRVESSFMFDPLDEKYKLRLSTLCVDIKAQPLEWKAVFSERVVERVSNPFKAWSGGALATDVYHGFFLEVWKRFNDNLRREGAPWAEKLKRWMEHYKAGTAPPRANGEAKIVHPWRVMYLQKGVAEALLTELYSEAKVLTAGSTRMRTALRVQRSLLSTFIASYDFAPWAAHIIRRFCVADEQRAKRRRDEAEEEEDEAPPPPSLMRGSDPGLSCPLSPSLSHASVAPQWHA